MNSVYLNIRPLQKFRQGIHREVTTGSNREDDLYTAWGRRYLAQLRDDFRRNRAGGGDWPPLAPATLKQGKSRIGILDVTGAVFNALRPGQPGNLFQRTPNGMKVGVGGPAKHPQADATIAQVVAWHNDGAGNLPVRRIINPPDVITTAGIQRDARAAVDRIAKESSEPIRTNR